MLRANLLRRGFGRSYGKKRSSLLHMPLMAKLGRANSTHPLGDQLASTSSNSEPGVAGWSSNGSHGVHSRLLETLNEIPDKLNELVEEDSSMDMGFGTENRNNSRIMSFLDSHHTSKYASGLYYRQLKNEEEQMNDAVNNYNTNLQLLMSMGKGTNMKSVEKVLLSMYEPLTVALGDEIKAIQMKVPNPDRTVYGPVLLLLPVEKLSIITLNTMLNLILRTGNVGERIGMAATQIADLIETEVHISKLKSSKKKLKSWESNLVKSAYEPANAVKSRTIRRKIKELLGEEEWKGKMKAKVGAVLIQKLIETAKFGDKEAFIYTNEFETARQRRQGMIRLDDDVFKLIAERDVATVLPRYLPMIVPPKKWNNRSKNGNCYLRLRTSIVRTHMKSQMEAVKKADMDSILEGLDYLGQIPWNLNKNVFSVFQEAMERGISVGELPPVDNVEFPSPDACYRLPREIYQDNAIRERQLLKMKEKQFKRRKQAAAIRAAQKGITVEEELVLSDAKIAERNYKKYGASEKENEENDVLDQTMSIEDLEETPIFDSRLYNDMCRRIRMKNAELHSLRCDTQLKYWVAEKFLDDTIYFPCNMDFRGRAYPIPPNLSHLGSDLCRGLLTFAHGKELGENGLFWLKVHLCNLFGQNKISFTERAEWTEQHLEDILDSAASPLDGNRWWTEAEEPFQALATCFEIRNALQCEDPAEYVCSLPIHQDGSCNGLQHYAALGKDLEGGAAVNLCPAEEPQDVYSRVLDIVMRKLKNDVEIPEEIGIKYYDNEKGRDTISDEDAVLRGKCARLIFDVTDRKVIKQTVMTSVYGVTRTGARAQVQARLMEKLMSDPTMILTPDVDKQIFEASFYLAAMTLGSLEEMFAGAKEIMDWLGGCAKIVALNGHAMSWVTPMGLPVIQPYRQRHTQTVRTTLQSITLTVEDDALPVSIQKQKSAFPPNYVHSLDATHMLMTALRMKNDNLYFASVHDSYWTHACDIPVMSDHIRDCFIELYSYPVLHDLRDSLVMRYPHLDFPPVPRGGKLNLEVIRDSPYFFH